ncbi:chemotaxis protein CheB [Flavobacterium sp. RHBU_3]|uniref:chemotaxis protein CheB n=1 Tax=Flavobacterium sp. RHBU_3 TaxID=3391184 RepID=UPI0039849CD1
MEKDSLIVKQLLLIGGSAGSLEVLIKVLPKLDILKNLSIVIVLHRANTEDSQLEELIALKTSIPVEDIEDKTQLKRGYIYVAPADYHLLFERNGELSLDVSEKVHYSRPSIDVVFQSAADAYGSGITAILLSGANADGTDGLKAVKAAGGSILIQDPVTAEISFMPQHALGIIEPDKVFTPEDLAQIINNLETGLDF